MSTRRRRCRWRQLDRLLWRALPRPGLRPGLLLAAALPPLLGVDVVRLGLPRLDLLRVVCVRVFVVRLVVVAWAMIYFHEVALFLAALLYVVGGLVLWLRTVWTGGSIEDALPEPWDTDEDVEGAPPPPKTPS